MCKTLYIFPKFVSEKILFTSNLTTSIFYILILYEQKLFRNNVVGLFCL